MQTATERYITLPISWTIVPGRGVYIFYYTGSIVVNGTVVQYEMQRTDHGSSRGCCTHKVRRVGSDLTWDQIAPRGECPVTISLWA